MRVNLKSARKALGMTQAQTAQKLNISLRFYQHLESGTRKGNIELWDKIEDLFGISQRLLRTDMHI